MRTAMVAAVAIVCGACGGSSGPVSVSGNIAGQSMGAQDAVSNVIPINPPPNSEGAILLTNAANTCAKLTADQQPKNAKAILIEIGLQTPNGVSAPTAAGTFTVYTKATVGNYNGNVALVTYLATDANCNPLTPIDANGGTVVVSRVDNNGYAGTFDITFTDASHIQGSFTANRCNALTESLGGTSCVP